MRVAITSPRLNENRKVPHSESRAVSGERGGRCMKHGVFAHAQGPVEHVVCLRSGQCGSSMCHGINHRGGQSLRVVENLSSGDAKREEGWVAHEIRA